MGKTYKTLKESFDYGTIVGGAIANVFNILSEHQGDKKFKDAEDIVNSLWSIVPSRIKRHTYRERGNTSYWFVWDKMEEKYAEREKLPINDRVELTKRRVWAKLQILTDLFFNEDVWIRTRIIDIVDEEDYELIYEEEKKTFKGDSDENQD